MIGDSVPSTLNIKIGDNLINRVDRYRYLGLIIDYNMKWDEHINYIIKSTRYLIFIFAKLKKFIDSKTLMLLYYVFF